jgi:MoaA/NifB/PqqE/SkfB family radical SAM enzyme
MGRLNMVRFALAAQNLARAVETNFNRAVGRELVPPHSGILHIETSSLCNLDCRFCAYGKKQSPKVSMKHDFFVSCVEQALALGYVRFEMTPCTGDVFMDRHVFDKFHYLDGNPDVAGYSFYTNFTVVDDGDVLELARLGKLDHLTISVYGHDLESFVAITRSSEKVYRRFLGNLEALYEPAARGEIRVSFGLRTTGDAPKAPGSELLQLLARFKEAGCVMRRSKIYSNWGGYIGDDDVKGLSIDVIGPKTTYKNGACALLFTDLQIMATGIVNGCACRDVDATLRIGDLNEKPLGEIISPRNPAYLALIEEQQAGHFRPVCRSCDFYQSIYHMRTANRRRGIRCTSIAEYMATLDAARSKAVKTGS